MDQHKMGAILFILQIICWLGVGFWLIDYYAIKSIILEFLVFGVTGLLNSCVFSLLAEKLGVVTRGE